MSGRGASKASKKTAEPKRAMSPLEEYEYLVAQVIRAAEETGPLVSREALEAEIEDAEGEWPRELTDEYTAALRVWPVLRLGYEDALFGDEATVWLVSDGAHDGAWLVHIVEGEPGRYSVGKALPGDLGDWDSATQKRIAQCVGEQLSSEGFGSPTDVSVPEALAWLLPGLEAVVGRMPKGSRPGLALA